MMEKCNFEGTELDLPVDLIENPEIFSHVLSLDTWKHVLTPEDRNKLKNYLPVLPTDYPHAQLENLSALFDGDNFKFGNPLETFRTKLQAGHYATDITKFRRQCKAAKQKEYKLKLKTFYRKLVHDVLISRQEIIDKVLSTSHQDTTITLSWHERQLRKTSSLSGTLESKYKKIMKEIKDECEDQSISSDEETSDIASSTTTATTNTFNQNAVTEEDYHKMLCTQKRKRLHKEDYPELDTRVITMEDIISRTNVTTKKVLKTVGKRKIKGKDKKEHLRKLKKKRPTPSSFSNQSAVPAAVSVETLVEPVVALLKTNDEDSNTNSKFCKYLENSSVCFFSLLRDIFFDLPDTTAEIRQLERMVGEWQVSPCCAASSWSFNEPSWINLISSALKYLGGSTKAVVNNPSFLSLVIFKQKVHQWKWIGTYRDKDSDLLPLCEHWLQTKDQVVDNEPATSITTSLNLIKRTDYVVGPSTIDEKSAYQNQERDRYENPHKPFIYQMHGFESIVAPVKGVFTKESNLNKAREHSLLVSKRPPYVTILTLVRDAAARLPNGEGTRAEVCQLLKDSQYINPDATDGQIHTVVSGALDRLHYEKDPCVKYDNARKVWIYLHKTRSVEEFETIHEASAAAARAKKQMSQKQKQIKQQQKAKETAISALNPSLSSSTMEEGDNIGLVGVITTLPETTTPTKPKKPKPKRASPKKTDKSKVKVKKESLQVSVPNPYDYNLVNSLPMLNPYQDIPPLDYHQDQNMFLSPTSSGFPATSRLNSPYMGITQPVQESATFGKDDISIKIEPGFENIGVRHRSSSSSSSSESESESGSSSGDNNGMIGQQQFLTSLQDSSLHFGRQRMPFNDVMSLNQGNPNGTESDSAYSGYY